MQYNNTTANNGIVQMIERTTNLGIGTITGDTNMFQYFNNLINQWMYYAAIIAWRSVKGWKLDDSNLTTRTHATTTLVDAQRDYTLPTNVLKISSVEVKNNAGDYSELRLLDPTTLKEQREQEDAGLPTHYYLEGRSLVLYPTVKIADVTASEGLRVTVEAREFDEFTIADTTQEPGFDTPFHPIVYLGPSYEWAHLKGDNNTVIYCEKMLGRFPGLLDMMKGFVADRNKQDKAVMVNPYLFNMGE